MLEQLWRAEAQRVSERLRSEPEVSFGAQELGADLLHAGLCSVRDNRAGRQVGEIVVILEEFVGPNGEVDAWGRRFQFVTGEQFLSRADGITSAPPNKRLEVTAAVRGMPRPRPAAVGSGVGPPGGARSVVTWAARGRS